MEQIETTGSVTSDNSNSVMSRVKMFEEKAATPKKQQVVVARRYYDIKTRQQIPVRQTPKEKAPVQEPPKEAVEERESTETEARDATDDSREQAPEIDVASAKKESPVKPMVWTSPTTPKKDSPVKAKVWTSPSNKASFSPRLGESSPAERSVEDIKKKMNLESSSSSPRPVFHYQSPRAFNEAIGANSTDSFAKKEEVTEEEDAPPAQIQIEESTKPSGTKSARLDAIRSSKAGLIAKEKRDLRRNLEAASTVMEEEKASSVGSGSSQSTRSSLSNEDLGNVAKRALKIAKVRGETTRTQRIQRGALHQKIVEKRLASKTTVEGSLQKQFDSETLPQFPTMTAPTVSESFSNASSVKLSSRLSRAERYANIRKQGHVKSGFKSDSKEEPYNHNEVVEALSKETHEDSKYSKMSSDEQSEVDSSSFKEIDDSSTITSKSSTTRSDRLAAISGYRNLKRNNGPIIITKMKNTVVQKSPSKLKDPPADIVAHQSVSSPSKSLASRAKRAKMLQAALEKTINSEETEVANKNDSHHILASLNEMESPSGRSKFKGFHTSPRSYKKVPEEPMVVEKQTKSPKASDASDQIAQVEQTTNVFEESFPDPSLADERNSLESLSTSSQSTSEPSRNYVKEKYLPEPTSAAVPLSSDVENSSMLLGEDISEVGSLDVSAADSEEECADQEVSSEQQTSPVKSTSDFSRESSGDDALRWWQKNYGENTAADTNQIVQNALAVVSPSRKLAVEDLKCTMQDRDSKSHVHSQDEVGSEPVQSFIDDESLFDGLEEEEQDDWQIRKKKQELHQKDKNHADMFPLSEETYSYSTEYSREENRVSTDHGVGSQSSSVPPPPPPPQQQGERKKEHETAAPKNSSRLVVVESNQNSITSDLSNSQRQPSNPSTSVAHRPVRTARKELTGNDIIHEIGKDIVDEIDNLIACIPVDGRSREKQRSRSPAHQDDLLDDSVVVNSMAYGKAKREKDGQQPSKSSSGSSLLVGLSSAITDTFATVLRLPKKLTDVNCTAPRAECTDRREVGLDICRVPSPDAMSAMNLSRSPDTKSSAYLNMTEHERRLWNAWEDRHLEEPMYSNGGGDVEDALSDGTNSPKSMSKEKQQERRDKAQKELLEIAGLAVSLYGGQVSKNLNGATKAFEDLMAAPSDSLQGSSIGETMVIIGEERETQDKDAARVPAQPPKALLEFSTLLKKKGVEVLKLGRSNKWQTRFLTVSKEVTFVKAQDSAAGDVGQCPKALLWVKRFDSHAHDINQLKKLGRGGVLFSDLNKVEYVKGENTSASRSFEMISKKLKRNFPAFHGCSVDYSFLEADGSKSNRSVMLCFKSRDDADAFIMAIKIIKDALSRQQT